MKKFNFDTTFTKGKFTYSIVGNDITKSNSNKNWLTISAAHTNALIEHWLDKVIIPQVDNTNPINATFDDLITAINYLEEALSKINQLKATHCSYGNKGREELEIKVHSLGSKFYDKIAWKKLSTGQRLVLKKSSNRSLNVSTYFTQSLYNPVLHDSSKLEKWWKELNDFDFKKYGFNKDSLINENRNSNHYVNYAKEAYQKTLLKIENFQAILKEAGEDIVNWSDQKISLRFTKLGIQCKAWDINEYVSAYTEHLISKGIKRVDIKKSTSKGKLKDLVENGKPTQNDLFRYYKQADISSSSAVLNFDLDLETLYLIIDSDLKCVKNKLYDKWGASNEFKKIALLLCDKSETKQDYKKIIKWAKPSSVTEKFMIKHKDHASIQEVTEYCQYNSMSTTEMIDEDFYQVCLTKIPSKTKFELSKGLTYQYMKRMNDTELVAMLKRIASEERSITFESDTLYNLYALVDYSLIKETILSSKLLLNHLALKIIKENDHETLIVSCDKTGSRLSCECKQEIFKILTFDEKKQVILNDSYNNFTGGIDNLSEDECLDLLKSTINSVNSGGYTTKIFRCLINLKDSINPLMEANKIVATMDYVDILPLNDYVISALTVDTKVKLLQNRINLKDSEAYSRYSRYSHSSSIIKITSKGLGHSFFHDFKRSDVAKVCASPVESQFRKFLAHTMSREELELCANSEVRRWNKDTNATDLDISFLRLNLELFSYGYLKQFKVKEMFRKVVGDRRNTTNKSFGIKLLEKLNVSNSVDFMFE